MGEKTTALLQTVVWLSLAEAPSVSTTAPAADAPLASLCSAFESFARCVAAALGDA